MQAVLSIMGVAASILVFVLFGIQLGSPKARADWRLSLAVGICFVVIAIASLVRLMVFGQSNGGIDGLWMAMYILVIWLNFSKAKKLRASQKKKDK